MQNIWIFDIILPLKKWYSFTEAIFSPPEYSNAYGWTDRMMLECGIVKIWDSCFYRTITRSLISLLPFYPFYHWSVISLLSSDQWSVFYHLISDQWTVFNHLISDQWSMISDQWSVSYTCRETTHQSGLHFVVICQLENVKGI